MTSVNSGHLVDTSVLIPYIRRNQSIVTRLDALPNKYLSPTVVAEMVYGAHRSNDPRDGMNRVTAITGRVPVLPIDEDIGYAFADLKNALVITNLLIPDNDIWIAATTMAYGLTLIARDAHFARLVPYGLLYQQW